MDHKRRNTAIILIDLNQVMIGALMLSINKKTEEIDENLIRHIVLNTLRSYVKQYRTKYGEVIICADSHHYWRKDVFPNYKANRKRVRDESKLDWSLIFDSLSKIKNELKANSPYKVIDVDGAEADDIIATLVFDWCDGNIFDGADRTDDPVLIISSDEDFLQLLINDKIEQFSPRLKQYINVENPNRFLKEHIIRGDSGDGVPNILSDDDVFIKRERQKPVSKEKLNKWLDTINMEEVFTPEIMLHYLRNTELIDLHCIPDELQEKIRIEVAKPKVGSRQKMLEYMIEHKMKQLIPLLDEF